MKWLLLFALVLFALLPLSVEARTSTSFTWYMRGDTDTVNGVTGYVVNATQSDAAVTLSESIAASENCSWGYRVWRAEGNNATTELTSGTPTAIVTRTANGNGVQSNTWLPTETPLAIGFDSLKLVAYVQFGAGAWTAKATFTTPRLSEATLLNETTTFYSWTNRTESGGTTYSQMRFGSSTYNTRIEDIAFAEPYGPESMLVELMNQNFFGFIMFPMNAVLGSLSYGVILLLICVPLVKRYNSFVPVLILFVLFGGGAGAFTLMIPEVGMSIGWVFMVIGLGGLLYKWTR